MKSLKRNYIYNLFYQVVMVLAPLITAPYIARVLRETNIGIYSYSEAALTYFKMFAALGIGIHGQRELSYVRDDINRRTKVFWETKALEFVTSTVAIVAYVIFSLNQPNSDIYLVLLLGLIAGMVDISWFFYGMEEVGKIVARNLIFKILGIAYIFLFVKTKDDLLIYAFGNMFFMLLSNLSLWLFLPKFIKLPVWKELHPFKHVKTVIALFLPTATTQLFAAIDQTMIGKLTDVRAENGFYDQALKIERLALTVVTSVAVVMIPRIGYYFSNNKRDLLEDCMYKAYRFVWMISIPLCLGIIGVATKFVPLFYGEGFEPVTPLLYVLSFLIIFMGINCISGSQYLIPTKRENKCTIIVWSGSLLNLTMNILLIPKLLAMGASIASLAAEIITMGIYFWVIRKELSVGKILSSSVKYWMAGLIMLVCLFLTVNIFAAPLINVMVRVIIGALVYGVALIVLKDELVYEVLDSFKVKIKSYLNR